MGRYEEAIQILKRSIDLIDDDPIFYEHLGDAYLATSMKTDALKAWEKALEFHEKEEGLKDRIEKKIRSLDPGR
jgi:tetratricopeptide (TPR) repeat protein